MQFQELNNDQRREIVNTEQRFQALAAAKAAVDTNRGSVNWAESRGRQYLVRAYYGKSGVRRQTSLGPRTPDTEKLKSDFDERRARADQTWKNLRDVMDRQAAVNRALRLGRVPLIGARIMRALDDFGLLGSGIRVLGTNAIYAYEAVAGVRVDPSLATTEDIDLLFDARAGLTFVADGEVPEASLLKILKRLDTSFVRMPDRFRAANRDGYLVDLIKPEERPPWKAAPERVGSDPDDLTAIAIEGLAWLQNSPAFEAVAIDEKGKPVRIVAPDPRAWAVHKLWLSQRVDRQPVKRQRDAAQAKVVAALVAQYLTHLPFEANQLRMLPKELVTAAAPLFAKPPDE